MHPRGRADLVSAILENFSGEIALQQRKTTAPHLTGKDGYKQMGTFAIEQGMILLRFEHELAIFAKIVDERYRGFRPI